MTDRDVCVRVKRELLSDWSAAIDKAIEKGMRKPLDRNQSWDVNEAVSIAFAYVKGNHEAKLSDMINGRINFKVAQMIESLCKSMELDLTIRQRPDGHLEFVIGEQGTFILPREHYANANDDVDEDEDEKILAKLAGFVTIGKPH